MIRKLVLGAFALGMLVISAAPKPAAACPLYACIYYHGHVICPPCK